MVLKKMFVKERFLKERVLKDRDFFEEEVPERDFFWCPYGKENKSEFYIRSG
jgi:hypothetical protein